MKICKVEITKQISGGDTHCKNIFPVGYDAETIEIICYGDADWDDGDNISYGVGLVADDFVFTKKMPEMTRAEAEMCIGECSEYLESDMIKRGKKVDDSLEARTKFGKRIELLPK